MYLKRYSSVKSGSRGTTGLYDVYGVCESNSPERHFLRLLILQYFKMRITWEICSGMHCPVGHSCNASLVQRWLHHSSVFSLGRLGLGVGVGSQDFQGRAPYSRACICLSHKPQRGTWGCIMSLLPWEQTTLGGPSRILQLPTHLAGFPVHGISQYWSGLLFPSLGDLPDPRIEAVSLALASRFFTTSANHNIFH